MLVTSGVRAVLNEFNKTVEQSDVGVPRSATKTLEARRAMQGSISRLGIIAVFPLFAIKVIEAAVDFRQWTISRQLRHRQKFTKASLSLLLTNSLSLPLTLSLFRSFTLTFLSRIEGSVRPGLFTTARNHVRSSILGCNGINARSRGWFIFSG